MNLLAIVPLVMRAAVPYEFAGAVPLIMRVAVPIEIVGHRAF